ncbi:hypothetical protein BDK92_1793 [Micromonospora pisi]|uniref:Uncharacterized protein n=1 Tax=Micromonospora pisi TaxID=589240 RepID=A0A495JGK4_9ACTN|nr:hypothetical protein BDK92_1793 [Micromonospora pisi]
MRPELVEAARVEKAHGRSADPGPTARARTGRELSS